MIAPLECCADHTPYTNIHKLKSTKMIKRKFNQIDDPQKLLL